MSRLSPLSENIKLNCTIVSDTHIDHKHPLPFVPKALLKNALSDAKKSKSPVDAFVIIGDTTSRGSETNWEMAKDTFSKVTDPAKEMIIAIGNHDTWADDGEDAAIQRYFRYASEVTGKKIDRTYFSTVVNGYYFIVIGSEKDCGCGAFISDEQIEWLRNEMKSAAESGNPVFIFCHQSFNRRHGLPRTFDRDETDTGPMDGGIGQRSDEIFEIISGYKNVFYFSGHSHMGFSAPSNFEKEGYSSFEVAEGVNLINLPSLACGNHHGTNNELGAGLQMEIYEDRVVFRPRSYMNHRWIKNIKTDGGKPYVEVKLN